MKKIIPIIIILGLLFLTGCQVNSEIKYQCANGEVVDSLNLCPAQDCPKLDCSECPKQVETKSKEVIKYQCYDGSVKDKLSDCRKPETLIEDQNPENNYENTKDKEIVKVDEHTSNYGDVLVSIQLYDMEDKGFGEYISIKNNRDTTISIGSGCVYPISPYADGCKAWAIRPYEDFPAFNYKYLESNSEVSGWVWGLRKDFFNQYNTTEVRLTIDIENTEISFIKTLENIATYQVNYKYDNYYDYEDKVIPQLEDEVNADVVGGFGNRARKNGLIYTVMHDEGGDFNENYRFWAVEINGETGELIKYKEISNDGCPGQPGQCPNSSQLWW